MAEKDPLETTDIIVCGCGPTGAMVSVLLSQYSIPHVVLEKDCEVNADPRGIALDEDGIRCLQACGIYDKIFTEIGQCMGNFRFIGKVHHDLSRKPFMMMNYSTTEGGTGHPGFMCHKQPCVEKHLRSQITTLGVAKMHLGARVTSIWEDQDWVYAGYTDTSNQSRTIRGKFLIGADGKTGFTRKKYLEPQGITLDQAMEMPYEEEWVALNWRISLPTPDTHPDFPSGRRGIRPSKSTMSSSPLTSDSCAIILWRFEFVVLPDEDSGEMAKPDQIAKVVYPYITHPGSRYGLKAKQVMYPLDCVEVLRCRPFRFSARSCNKWALGRVVLCGDAAHVFPPFGGQGIASAFRDAISLVWRLRIAANDSARGREMPDYQKLLRGWYSERKQQLDKSLRSTVENGDYVTESSIVKVFLRDWYLWLIQVVPSWKNWLQLGNRRDGMVRYQWQEGVGMAFLHKLGGGRNFPQVYAVRITNTPRSEKVLFTDDIIFSPQKKGLFQVVVILQPRSDADGVETALRGLEEISNGVLRDGEVTVFLNNIKAQPFDLKGRHIYRIATATEFTNDPILSAGRPEPKGYDPHRISKEVGNKTFVILRPDRFVFAACDTRSDLVYAAQMLRKLVATGAL
ncbi:hypothetical protein MRS44_007034 [Fusarium solani]|uniref:uncharacterized protein n=1 Tax=Fusarium solani TaxID=169388 RepID=UPI0032C47D82|nr:hypothetical protein MRS44_007034 [Fusarium solani]